MAIRLELSADAARGPGYGVLRIQGLAEIAGPVRLWIQRNQGAETFLGLQGVWVTQKVLHELPQPGLEDGAAILRLGPALTDPIALLPPNCMVMIGIETDGARGQGRVTIRNLLASTAAGAGVENGTRVVRHEEEPVAPPVEPLEPPEPQPVIEAQPDPSPLVADANERPALENGNKRSPLAIILGVVGVAVGLTALAFFAGLPPFGKEQPPAPAASAPATSAPAPAPAAAEGPGPLDSREALARYIGTNPAGAEALAQAQALAAAGKLDLAMLLYQYASRQGEAAASLALGHFYDPDTWSKETSPMDRPDAETAAYWYEPAARAGNAEAQRRLGKILLGLPDAASQKDKARDWLTKAAGAGDAEAKALLDKAQ